MSVTFTTHANLNYIFFVQKNIWNGGLSNSTFICRELPVSLISNKGSQVSQCVLIGKRTGPQRRERKKLGNSLYVKRVLSSLRKLESSIMKKSFELLVDYFPRSSEVEDFLSTSIANCAFNSFLSYTAIMLNIVTIHAIRKTPSLSKTLRTLLLSLSVSDVGVGLLSQPFYTSLLIKWSQKNTPGWDTYKAFLFTAYLFSLASFCGVVAVSVDRFLAIHLHPRYQELVTRKRVVAVVISIWVSSVFVSFLMFFVPPDNFHLIILIIGVVGLILTTMAYIRIYLAVRWHKNQIQVLQVQQVAQAGEVENFSSLAKSAVGTFYVYLVFLVCYMPYLIVLISIETNGSSIVSKQIYLFAITLAFLNSSLNPVIYSW